jgi:O-antigen/teichoic acid export membrane protein
MSRSNNFDRLSCTAQVRSDLKKKSIRGAFFMALSEGLELCLRFGSIVVLARLLSPEYFGLIAMVTAFTGIVEGIRDLGLGSATIQRHQISHRQVTNLFWVNASAGLLFTLLFCTLAFPIAGFYQDTRLVNATVAVSLTFLLNGISVQHEALMSRQLRQGELGFIRLLASAISTAGAVWLAMAGFGYWALVAREVIRSAIVAAGVWIACPWIPGRPSRGVGTRGLLRFGRDLTLTHLLTSLIANIDRLLIGRFYGPSSLGLYRQAQQLLMVPIDQLNAPIAGVARPGLSALQHQPLRYRRYYEKIVFLVCLTTFPLGMFVALYAEEVTLFVLGPAWTGAALLIAIFAVAAAVRPAVATSAIILVSSGQSAKYLQIAVVHSIVLAVFLVLGVHWGAEGVAIAHLATTLVLMLPKLYYSFLNTPVTLRAYFAATRTPFLAVVVMVSGLLAFRSLAPISGTLPPLITGAAFGALLYVGAWLMQAEGRRQFKTLLADVASASRSEAVRPS